MSRIDGALSVAHAFTTHAVSSDVDWFTGMDDLTQELDEAGGAAHLNTQEFGAGVFYRYISLNIGQLERNMEAGRADALNVARTTRTFWPPSFPRESSTALRPLTSPISCW